MLAWSLLLLDLLADAIWLDMQLGNETTRHINLRDMRTELTADQIIDTII
jgi:hypothetical protein